MKKILIIDDDVYIGDLLQELLSRNNYQIYRCYSGTEALSFLDTMTPDLILLDLMLPGMSGEAVLAKIKAIPVIVLSAKADINDKVELLYLGAADYMTKPFDTRELLARIAVQLRNEPPGHNAALVFKDLTLDPHTYQVHIKNQPVRLTKTEYAILKLLMTHPSQVNSKSTILDRSGEENDCMESSLKVHISNLRRKLREFSNEEYIEAVWGIGFKMKED